MKFDDVFCVLCQSARFMGFLYAVHALTIALLVAVGVRLLDGHCYKVASKAACHNPAIATLVDFIESSAHTVISKKLF